MIRQFDVCANPVALGREERPYLVAIQHNRLSDLSTRILVPLVVRKVLPEESRLSPTVVIHGRSYFIDPTNIVTLPLRRLGQAVANLEADRDRIIAAIDLVFTGV
jgi:toxin CcdB